MEAAAPHSKRASNSLVRHVAPVFMKRDPGGEVGIPTAFAISDGWEGRLGSCGQREGRLTQRN
jgi:hypothetical protein